MEVWGQITFHGEQGSANSFFNVIDRPSSNARNAVWRMSKKANATIALGNYSDIAAPVTVTFADGDAEQITVAPHGTELIKRRGNNSGAEAVTISSEGQAGRLYPIGFISDAKGFDSSIRFADTENVAQSNLYSTNFRLKNTTPSIVLKNTTANPVTATPRFLPVAGEGDGVVELPAVTVPANGLTKLNLTTLINAARTRTDLDSVSVQIINSGDKGSLIGAANFTNNTTGVSYDIPLRDSGATRNSAGGYPIRLDGDYTTVYSVTNVGDQPGQFTMQTNYGNGGVYAMYPQELAPGASAIFDIRKIRDEQIPDSSGRFLPLDLTIGQIRWSIVGAGMKTRLIGRSEIISKSGKVSSSYSCGVCCNNSYYNGSIQPNLYEFEVGDTHQFLAMQRDTDCYGNLYSPYNVNATWTYADENIATVDFWNGTVTAVGVGDGVITADWTGTTWLANQNDDCEHNDFPVQQISDAMVSPKVRILRDNQTINGTQNVIVGQRINLSLSVDGGSPSSQTWTIPDHAVDKFEVLDSNGQPTASQTPTTGHVVSISGLSSNAINYVWTDDGSKQVQVTARINGTDYPASANFTVNKPTTTVTATGGHAAIDTSSPSKDLYLGGVTQNDVGILISRSNTTVPQGFSGSFQFVQLISGHIDATPIGGSKVTTNLVTGLDGCYPYSASSTSMDDSPFVGLVQPNATLSFAEYVGSWKVYLMFKPSSTGSSWVTLKKLTWTWDGKAILVPNSSPPQWTPSDVTAPGNPTGSDSTEFPTWTAIAPNAGGPC